MAFDESLAQRIRDALARKKNIEEKKMFGGGWPLRIAQAEFDKYQPTVVVGLSHGGVVAMNIKSSDAKIVLVCPAWKK
jgi:hypothetical protein